MRVRERKRGKALACGGIFLRLSLVAFLIILLPSHHSSAQLLTMVQPRLAPDRSVEDFTGKLDMAARTGDFVGLAVAVVKDGEVVTIRTYGDRKAGIRSPVDENTRFRIASLSKGFAASLAAQLATEDKLALDKRVHSFAPAFRLARPEAAEKATIEDVLSHRLGLPPYAYDNLLEARVPIPNIFDRLSRVELICPVGQCYSYQNVAYSLIEPAIEQSTGQPFPDAVASRIFKPLGMESASYGADAFMRDENWARPHIKARRAWHQVKPDDAYYRVPSAGGINASIKDMAQWVKAQMGAYPHVLSQDALMLAQKPRIRTVAELRRARWLRPRLRDAYYALGWRVYDYAGHPVIMHNGGLQGYGAQIAILPESGLGLVALWNSSSSRGWAIMPTLLDAHLRLDDKDWLKLDCRRYKGRHCTAGQGRPSPAR